MLVVIQSLPAAFTFHSGHLSLKRHCTEYRCQVAGQVNSKVNCGKSLKRTAKLKIQLDERVAGWLGR